MGSVSLAHVPGIKARCGSAGVEAIPDLRFGIVEKGVIGLESSLFVTGKVALILLYRVGYLAIYRLSKGSCILASESGRLTGQYSNLELVSRSYPCR